MLTHKKSLFSLRHVFRAGVNLIKLSFLHHRCYRTKTLSVCPQQDFSGWSTACDQGMGGAMYGAHL